MPPASLIPFILHYARPFWPLLLASGLFSTVIALLEVMLFAFLGRLVDWLATAERATFWADHSGELVLMGVVVLAVLPVLKFVYGSISHQGLLGNFAMRTRWQAHRYLLRQSMEFYQDDFAGRVAAKMMQTALAVRDIVMKLTEVLLYVVVYFGAAVVLFASSDLRLTAPMLLWLAGYLIAMRYFVPRLRDWSMAQAEARSVVTGRVVDSYTNIGTVKMFAHAAYEDSYAREGMEAFLEPIYGQMRLSTMLNIVLNTLNAGLIFAIAGMAVWLWYIDATSAGAIALAVGLVLRLQGMSQWIIWEVSNIFENIGVVLDGVETIARERAIEDAPNATTLAVAAGGIRYDHISFNYGKDREDVDQGVLSGLDLDIKPGEKVGIVGRSGAGKSTLVSLLLRFYDLQDGRILIDGQDIAGVSQDSLRAQIAMVTQDTSLLHRSVLDNISYSKPGATEPQVVAAAKAAHADDFIHDLEDGKGRRGYQAHVGERGVKLSGGQRQRIAIARVLLKDAPILILDEATSALDSEVEAAIQESFQALMAGKTVIAIAHRLSTIAAMDRLIVMDQGRIVEEGNHETLLRRGGLYAELWSRQSGGFLAKDVAE
ncbi:MAG: ABC transporter ATP-binding protein [Alphaproteobacteria bacterium]|nr:ABC transporter ATP-binding protein [Alphaproteobacteria bacterium]MDP6253271.1 ABC transporter ATP-binding protein [Alphaproteobacteria bacterium]MDP7055376.1 ABC transporter ATP-binding protein [Alphaproteobacteria bacterium]MDP7227004.1 ABC transporter ATP-binding protein [Alphaproteobacteria bacterium]MDP7459969.1 ABC transporter ATP-binding protein [Alphaproteobacteria bacterium]